MKSLALTTAFALLMATSAGAGGIAFSLPDLTFPPSDSVTVAKDCIATNATPAACTQQE